MLNKYCKYIDNTLLSPQATETQIKTLCKESRKYGFASVCVNPCFVKLVNKQLKGSKVKTCVVIGFPLGANTTATKVFEAKDAIKNGAQELDMVVNVGKVKENNYGYITKEIAAIKKVCGNKILKNKEKVALCKCIKQAKADFVKTSTGFSTGGATVADIKLLKKSVKNTLLIKASGGIKTREDMIKMIKAGANRIGTSRGSILVK